MGPLDEVKQMQQKGLSEEQIIASLRDKGVSYKNISEALTQSKIKAAVEEPLNNTGQQVAQPQTPIESPPVLNPPQEAPQTQDFEQPLDPRNSQGNLPVPYPSQEQYTDSQGYDQEYPQDYAQSPDQYGQPYDQGYDQSGYGQEGYDYQSSGVSSETISEISEQVVAEKMSELRKQLENAIDIKTNFESKLDLVEERLKRIEKVIDTLQSSVLRKVGDYVTNIEDIKKEIVSTQKTFSKIAERKHHTSHSTKKKKTSKRKK
jgi:DNA-binding transcriptional MerR regulator